MKTIFEVRQQGLYIPDGGFYIDAWGSVPVNLVTHAHGDHAYFGHELYITAESSLDLLRYRFGPHVNIQTYPYGQRFKIQDCWISFHPAGHILGSSQIRIETKDGVSVFSGDYKRASDPTCAPFEVVECDTFVTESTFALPIYHWEPGEITAKKILAWWHENQALGQCSVLFCYAMGKAERILALLAQINDRPIYAHGSILNIGEIYTKQGINLGTLLPLPEDKNFSYSQELILAPPSAKLSPWLRRFYPCKTAMASGWMAVRGMRKQRNVDASFVLSDHADWADLLRTIKDSRASTILTTHGDAVLFAKYLREQGLDSRSLKGLEEVEAEAD